VEQVTTMLGVLTHEIMEAVRAHADAPTSQRILGRISESFTWLANKEAEA
jgi:hypothetical protein